MIQSHVLRLPRSDTKHGSEAVELECVESVIERVFHERENGMNTLLRFQLAPIHIFEQVDHDILEFGCNAVEVLVGKVDQRINEGFGIVAKMFGQQLEMGICGRFLLRVGLGRRCSRGGWLLAGG